MARVNNGVRVLNPSDPVPTDAEGGYAGGDSTAASVSRVAGVADVARIQAGAAQETVQNLQGSATTLPYGTDPTVSVSGAGTTKTIHIGIPLGMPEDVGGDLVAAAESAQASSASSASSAAMSLVMAQGAQAAVLEIPDANTAAMIGNPATDTAQALDAWSRANSITVSVRDFGALGNGLADDTAAIQAAVDYVSGEGGGTVLVPPSMTCMIAADAGTSIWNNAGGIDLKSDVTLHISRGSTLRALPVSTIVSKVVRIHNRTNAHVTGGGTIDGNRANATVTTGEWGYGVSVNGGSHISVTDVRTINCWGDGINLQRVSAADLTPPRWVYVQGVESRNNRRQGMSIESGDFITVSDSTFADTNGALPMCGIVIEQADTSGKIDNVTISRCSFTGNQRAGVQSWENGVMNGIRVVDCTFDSNGADGLMPQIRMHVAGKGVDVAGNVCTNTLGTHSIEIAGPSMGARVVGNRTDKGAVCLVTGIITGLVRGLTVRDNNFAGTLQVSGQFGATIEGNTITPAAGTHAIDFTGTGAVTHTTVKYNIIEGGINGIHCNETTAASNLAIEGNSIVSTSGPAVVLKGGDTVNIVGNTFEGCCLVTGQAIIHDLGGSGIAAIRRRVQGNTFRVAARPGSTASQTPAYAYMSDATLSETTVKDNTVSSFGFTFSTYPASQATAGATLLSERFGLTPARSTTYRPAGAIAGQMFYDTTLGKPIFWSGTGWRDATGAPA